MLTVNDLVVGGRYNWKGQEERLFYIGRTGAWHCFAKTEAPEKVWCEVLTQDLRMLEKTVGAPPKVIHFDVEITGYQQLSVTVPAGASAAKLMDAKIEEFMANPILSLRQKRTSTRRLK